MAPLVSIITPCYNAAPFLQNTIESVINQTYSNWEMLIVDDCSTDSSAEIIKQFAEKDSRIRYFRNQQPSGSPSKPRNIGIELAKGKYIAFLDADDVWLSQKLELQITEMEEKGLVFVYSDYEKINQNGDRNNRIIHMPQTATFWDVIETCVIPCLTVVIERNTIGDTRFKTIAKEDLAFWLEILRKGIIAHNCNCVLALYREMKNSRSSNKLDMIRNQWFILRQIEHVKPFIASIFMMKYLIYGFLKFLK